MECGKCIKACGEREAIKDDYVVIDSRCIGCEIVRNRAALER